MRQLFHTIAVPTRGKGLYALRRPMLGTWQGIYVFEHRRAVQTRNLLGE